MASQWAFAGVTIGTFPDCAGVIDSASKINSNPSQCDCWDFVSIPKERTALKHEANDHAHRNMREPKWEGEKVEMNKAEQQKDRSRKEENSLDRSHAEKGWIGKELGYQYKVHS